MVSNIIRFVLVIAVSGVSLHAMERNEQPNLQPNASLYGTVSNGWNYLYEASAGIVKRAKRKYNDFQPVMNMLGNHNATKFARLEKELAQNPLLQDLHVNLGNYTFPDHDKIAKVAISNTICHDEQAFVHARMAWKVIPACERFLGRPLEHHERAPVVTVIGSGGGVRSQNVMLSALCALHKCGMLDMVTYMMGLSGSTGAIFPYVAHAETNPESYRDFLKGRLADARSYTMTQDELESFHGRCLIAQKYKQPQGLVCSYGASLANAFLSNPNKHHLSLSDLWPIIEDGDFPMPIGVAVDTSHKNQIWVEFNPCRITQIGACDENNLSIQTKFAGRVFNEGTSIESAPSLPLSNFLGVWWSAFAASHGDIMHELPTPLQSVYKSLHKFGNNAGLCSNDDIRIAPYRLPNFAYGMPGALNTEQLHSEWVDGGFKIIEKKRHNFASVPALWRNVNIMIMIDSNKDTSSVEFLIAAADQAHEMGYKFPKLTDEKLTEIVDHGVAILEDADKETPIVVYIKLKEHQVYNEKIGKKFNPAQEACCGTSQFTYTNEDFDLLAGLVTHSVEQAEGCIAQAIISYFDKNKQ